MLRGEKRIFSRAADRFHDKLIAMDSSYKMSCARDATQRVPLFPADHKYTPT